LIILIFLILGTKRGILIMSSVIKENVSSVTTCYNSPIENTSQEYELIIEESPPLAGSVEIIGAKNAVLVIMSSLLLTSGKSTLRNVPCSEDVVQMMQLMQELGVDVHFDTLNHTLHVDTTLLTSWSIRAAIMKKMRASVLVAGPLLARFGRVEMALPGGDLIGARPIDFHLKNFEKMGATFFAHGKVLSGVCDTLQAARLVLEYPSVGATENLMMAAALIPGVTTIVNAALEPEVIDLIGVLQAMGASISITCPATIIIEGVSELRPVNYTIMGDRLEAGTLLLAAAITGGSVSLPNARADVLDVFLLKLDEMGHTIACDEKGVGISFQATSSPRAVSFRTAPYPGFPSDLQAPMLAALCLSSGSAQIQETVYENRLLHVRELQKMGAQIQQDGDRALITGVDALYGARVIASDIRASAALVVAGLGAKGTTVMTGVHHWRRGYEALETKLASLGARISMREV
jgi:UDP-N-acetylglucosamine 1-carboxyvinyltransferase